MRFLYSFVVLALFTCGSPATTNNRTPPPSKQDQAYAELSKKVMALEGSISSLVISDFATCAGVGETADALIKRICQIAQASTVEGKVELKAELGREMAAIRAKLDGQTLDFASLDSSIAAINSQLSALSAMVSAGMAEIIVGNENALAGPMYESMLRRQDRTSLNAYVESYGPYLGLLNNSVTATNGSTTVTITRATHGYVNGQTVELATLAGGRGLSNGDLTGEFVVSGVALNTFQVVVAHAATSSGTLGGTLGTVRRVIGRGMSTFVSNTGADDTDVAVRTTTLGSKRYNFIVKEFVTKPNELYVCYSWANPTATFAQINVAVVADINEATDANTNGILCK